jgi:hypothetical protein
MIHRFLSWLALSDKMPEHESLPDSHDIWNQFRDVTRYFGRETPSFLGNKIRPFSVEASKWLRNRRGRHRG